MNKRLKLFLTLLVFFIAISITNICYGKSYTIDNIDMKALINSDGSVQIKQTMTYTFNGQYNGIYVTIPYDLDDEKYDSQRKQSELKDSLYNAQDVTIKRVTLDGVNFEEVSYAANGSSSVFTLDNKDGIKKVKIFSPSYNQTKTFEMVYVLDNVCVKHNDVGELYYNFIGGAWDVTIKNLNIDVYLNQESTDLKIWGHGNYNGVSEIMSNSHANFRTYDVRPGEYVAVRMMFEANCINDATKVSGMSATDLIMKDEKVIGQNIESKKHRTQKTQIFCLVLFIYWIILLLIYELDKKYSYHGIDDEELFKKYNPLIAGCIQGNRDILARDIIAVILNLINKKVINLEITPLINNKNKSEYIYKVSQNPSQEEKMDKIERFIYEWFFEKSDTEILSDRLKEMPKEANANEKFKQLDILAKSNLNLIGANKSKVPKLLRIFNNIIFIIAMIWGLVSFQELSLNIFNNEELKRNLMYVVYVCIVLFPLVLTIIWIILLIIIKSRKFIVGKVQKHTGQKVVTTTITILFFTIIIIALTYIFTSARGLIFDEILISLSLIICLTDNLMLKNSKEIEEDFGKLNSIKQRIDNSLMYERDVEYINLWNEYLAYAVAFGNASKIMKKIKVITVDDDLMKMLNDELIKNYIYNDYAQFYSDATLDSRFLDNFASVVSSAWESIGSSDGDRRRLFWWRRLQPEVAVEAGGRRSFLVRIT